MSFAEIMQYIMAHYVEILVAIVAIFLALIALIKAIIVIAMMIPGPQPEAFLQKIVDALQKVVDFLGKFSKK